MTTFLLLHGGQHGAWCWERLTPLLEAEGHRVAAPDLPMGDPNAGAREWAQRAAESVSLRTNDIVAVAHSMSGFVLGLIPEVLPVRRLVAISAMLAQPGVRFVDYQRTPDGADVVLLPRVQPASGEETRGEGTTWSTYRNYYAEDCSEEDARWAWEQLGPRAYTVFTEPPTLAAWPAVPTTSIVMSSDRVVNPAWSRRAAQRIGGEIIELPGGHSPMLAQPQVLARILLDLAERPS